MRHGTALAALTLAAACQKQPDESRFLLVQQSNGLPAPGVTIWCTYELGSPEPTHRHEIRRQPAVTDAQGKVSFAGNPEHCGLSADGAEVEPSSANPSASGTAVRVTPLFGCSSALLVVPSAERWLLSWYRPKLGFTSVASVSASEISNAAHELWRANGQHREPSDRRRDCALIASGGRSQDATDALQKVSRSFEAGEGSVQQPAFETHVWEPDALCHFTAKALPDELRIPCTY